MKKNSWAVLLTCAIGLGARAEANEKAFNLNHEHVPGQLIVGFERDVPVELKGLIVKKITDAKQTPNFTPASQQSTYLLESKNFLDESSLRDLAKHVASLPGVRFVEANNIYRLDETLPNDPLFDRLYGLKNNDSTNGLENRDIGATLAWDITTGSKDILVGVIDTGIDYNHPDIAANYWKNPGETGLDANGQDKSSNGIDDDGNGYIDDWRGWDFFNNDNDPLDGHSHGTHCAGTIGAVGNNAVGVVGVNWNVSMVGIKIFSDSGMTTTEAIVEGIHYATTIGVDVTSNSWGGGAPSQAIFEAIAKANQAGIIFVAASGNSSVDTDAQPHYPSSYDLPNIISVASSDRQDRLSGFSNYGLESVDVAAPGSEIYSTVLNGEYGYKSGTSMATPHVSGVVALVKSYFPNLTHLEIRDRILTTSSRVQALSGKIKYGRINANSALEIDEVNPNQPDDLQLLNTGLKSVQASWKISGDDGDEGVASRYEVKFSEQPITEDMWSTLAPLNWKMVTSDSDRVTVEISGLEFNTSGFLAIKAYDNVGNASAVSISIPFKLKEAETLYINEGQELSDFASVDDPWGVSDIDGNSVISDSPDGLYANDVRSSIVTKDFMVRSTDMYLEVKNRYQLESLFDFGFIDIQVDEGPWKTLATLNGESGWTSEFIHLSPLFEQGEAFRLRFRLETDSSVTREGWDIDSIRIISEQM